MKLFKGYIFLIVCQFNLIFCCLTYEHLHSLEKVYEAQLEETKQEMIDYINSNCKTYSIIDGSRYEQDIKNITNHISNALHMAVILADIDFLKKILPGLTFIKNDIIDGKSNLLIIANNLEDAQALNSSINRVIVPGETALSLATYRKLGQPRKSGSYAPDVVKLLLDAGANPDIRIEANGEKILPVEISLKDIICMDINNHNDLVDYKNLIKIIQQLIPALEEENVKELEHKFSTKYLNLKEGQKFSEEPFEKRSDLVKALLEQDSLDLDFDY